MPDPAVLPSIVGLSAALGGPFLVQFVLAPLILGLAVHRLRCQCSRCSMSAYRSIIMSLPLIWEVSSAVAMSSWPGS